MTRDPDIEYINRKDCKYTRRREEQVPYIEVQWSTRLRPILFMWYGNHGILSDHAKRNERRRALILMPYQYGFDEGQGWED